MLGLPVPADLQARVKHLDAQAMGRQILLTSRRFFERLARQRPLVLVFEDLHWVDQSSTELIEHLFPLVERVPLLFCGVSRREADTPAARLRAIARQRYDTRYSEVLLAPLSAEDSGALLEGLLGTPDISPRLRELVAAKTEGNPLFMEEVVRSLVALGVLARDETRGVWRLRAAVEEVRIPDTIQGVIMARIDRLGEDVKHVLKLAAVIGRSFFYRVLNVPGRRRPGAGDTAIGPAGRGVDPRAAATARARVHIHPRARPGGDVREYPGRAPTPAPSARSRVRRGALREPSR